MQERWGFFNCIFVLTLYLQVFYKKSLLELELYSLYVSLRQPPLPPVRQVEISTEALSGAQWVEEVEEREGGLCSLEASWSLFVDRKQICLDASS